MNERTIVQDANETISRRGVFGLLAGALVIAGFAGAPSAEARRRGGHGRGRGRGRGRRYDGAHADGLRRGHGGRGRGRHDGRRKRHDND